MNIFDDLSDEELNRMLLYFLAQTKDEFLNSKENKGTEHIREKRDYRRMRNISAMDWTNADPDTFYYEYLFPLTERSGMRNKEDTLAFFRVNMPYIDREIEYVCRDDVYAHQTDRMN